MNEHVKDFRNVRGTVTDNFVPAGHYTSREFLAEENAKLWPKVWQMACRAEEIAEPGAYVVYDILNESIILSRGEDGRIRGFHNVCPHRGNQLVLRNGRSKGFVCGFHGWKWDLEGKSTYVKDHGDWAGCPAMENNDLHLKQVQIGEWGGFVFINLDPDCEPFEEFIAPVPECIGPLDFDKMRIAWYKTMPLKGNWKTTMESFMESYHVYTTHPQVIPFLDEISVSWERGKHGNHGYPNSRLFGLPSQRSGLPVPDDVRQGYVTVVQELAKQTGGDIDRVGAGSGRAADAVGRVLTEVPATATIEEVHVAGMQFMKEAAEADGAGWPEFTMEQAVNFGVDWNIFPNVVLVFGLDATLVFRARPDKEDPNKCLFDMWGLLRVAPDKAPAFKREFYENWRENIATIPSLLVQDLHNIERIQRGMNSASFEGSRLNPVQERQIYNHHRVLRVYIDK